MNEQTSGTVLIHATGEQLKCQICSNDQFVLRKTLMNTWGLTIFNLDWLNRAANSYICTRCGYVHWFMDKV
ncbi:MAG: hypothetical protein GC154_12970 [bacterium]|nr:hypothetical protein [bacterium]